MIRLFAIQWLFTSFLQILSSIDREYRRRYQRRLRDFAIGALLGVVLVEFVYFGKGFFVERQFESTFIRVIAFILTFVGTLFYLSVVCCVCVLITLCSNKRDERRRRMEIIEQLDAIPFGTLAFNVEMTCAICLEDFAAQDQVIVLSCSGKHIFHKICMNQWAKESTHAEAQCPLCRVAITN